MRQRSKELNDVILAIVETTRNASEAARLVNAQHGTKLTGWSVARVAKANGVELTEGRKTRLQNLMSANAQPLQREQSRERLKALWKSADFRKQHKLGVSRKTKNQVRQANAHPQENGQAAPAPT